MAVYGKGKAKKELGIQSSCLLRFNFVTKDSSRNRLNAAFLNVAFVHVTKTLDTTENAGSAQ